MNSQPATGATLLSTVQRFKSHDFLQKNANHPFAASFENSAAQLQNLIQATDQLSHSLNLHSSIPLSNPKLISILRQEAAISHTVHLSDQSIRQTVEALRVRSGTSYGEDIPLDRSLVIDWAISRLESWGSSVGMETFKEDLEREGRMTFVLGGKVLVLDIDLSVDRTLHPGSPRIDVKSLKTSYAIPNGAGGSGSATANTEGSASLDVFLATSIGAFLHEVQKDTDLLDAMHAERLGNAVAEQLEYLMMLDKVAAIKEEEGGGIRWFVDIDELGAKAEKFASREADVIASSLSLPTAPLDIYLNRSHGLPLPYLSSPSLSFLVHLSPLAYLSVLRTGSNTSPPPPSNDNLPKIDTPIIHLRNRLSAYPSLKGATIATLVLTPYRLFSPDDPLSSIAVDTTNLERPTFPLAQPENNHIFPQLPIHPQDPTSQYYTWILDFTSSGKHKGLVISQSRMREIECVLDPAGAAVSDMSDIGMMGFGNVSGSRDWVDMLVNNRPTSSQEVLLPKKYTALYHSPSSLHPPLRLRLTPPDEPGFVLERVKVKNMLEVWGILEVVKEQCWINELLSSPEWALESSTYTPPPPDTVDNSVSDEILQALLRGTHTPNEIPVEIFVPPPTSNTAFPSVTDLTFDLAAAAVSATQTREPPKITMTLPERLPITGFTEVIVSYDQTRGNGVKVEIGGRMGMEGSGVDVELLEEVCRRGGGLGVAGRIWKASEMVQ